MYLFLNFDAVRSSLYKMISLLEWVNSAFVMTDDDEAFVRETSVRDMTCNWAGDLSSCSHDAASSRCVTIDALRVAMDFTRTFHLCAFSSELKGKSLNPSALDQTCFSHLIQKRILLFIFLSHLGHWWRVWPYLSFLITFTAFNHSPSSICF